MPLSSHSVSVCVCGGGGGGGGRVIFDFYGTLGLRFFAGTNFSGFRK